MTTQYTELTHDYLPEGKVDTAHTFEVVMLADQWGNIVGPANPSGVAVDAFGRARMSTPLTLFDSSHRFKDNGLWNTANTSGNSTYAFSTTEGLINLNVTTGANAEVIRETTKVFSYQPGKSLQILTTFVMNTAKPNLRQRVGYFGTDNGIYLELDGSTLSFVERSNTTGTITETRVNQANWNMDTLLGNVDSSPSKITLDISKAQIMFIDVEWLGLGTVRCGFVINGQLVHCHSFHHANQITSTYMTTASLPLRQEIKNTGITASNSTMKQVCSTVISEGGYELRGTQQAVGTVITAPKALATAGTYYPVVSIRLKSTALDAIVIMTALSILGRGNGVDFNWQVISGGTVTTSGWTPASADSAVEYTISGTAITGGRVLASGFLNSSTQASPSIDVLKEALFKFQLERNTFSGVTTPLTLAIAAGTDTSTCFGSMDWEEVTR
jgi:hypothetical protein